MVPEPKKETRGTIDKLLAQVSGVTHYTQKVRWEDLHNFSYAPTISAKSKFRALRYERQGEHFWGQNV